jgi:hypothetical protein
MKALDPDPYWSPASNSGSGSGKNEYGSTTLEKTVLKPFSPLDGSLDNGAPHTRDLLAHF